MAPEALLRAGLVYFSVGDHGGALHRFTAAQPLASEPELKYLAHFLTGRAMEALDRHDEAIGQYRRALDIVPGAESAVVALASLQFLHNDRDASVSLIDRTFATPTRNTDPGRMIGYGYFLRWPAIQAAMRAELRR